MSSFTSPARLELLNNGTWKLIEEFEYHVGKYPSNNIITVPKGFVTDLMTVPRFILPFFNPLTPQYAKPAIIHDYLYDITCTINLTKKEVDKIFLEAMIVTGVSKIKRQTIYWAVRIIAGKRFKTTLSKGIAR